MLPEPPRRWRAYSAKMFARSRPGWRSRSTSLGSRGTLLRLKRRRVKALGLPGIRLERESRRYYPGGLQTGSLLGFVDIDGRGLEGLELSLDDLLAGRRVRRTEVRDAAGRLMTRSVDVNPEHGAAVSLTLHRSLQFSVYRALRDAVAKHKAKAATAVMIEVGSGNVLAMVNWPSMDGNRPRQKSRQELRNRAVTDSYETGSIMKVFTIASALQNRVVTPETRFDLGWGRAKIAGKVITDTHSDKELNVGEILKRSSNVGAAKIAHLLGAEALHQTLVRLGFGATTGIELPGEQTGILRSPDTWGPLELATHGYGYGMSATPPTADGSVGGGG